MNKALIAAATVALLSGCTQPAPVDTAPVAPPAPVVSELVPDPITPPVDEVTEEAAAMSESMADPVVPPAEEVVDETITTTEVVADPIVPPVAAVNITEYSMDSFSQMIAGKPAPRFSLDTITARVGDTVRINITTTSGTHNFNIDEFGVRTETPTGETVTVEFVVDKAGSFEYYCSKPGHRANGHWGTLVVTAA